MKYHHSLGQICQWLNVIQRESMTDEVYINTLAQVLDS